jgi:hypothetical protein
VPAGSVAAQEEMSADVVSIVGVSPAQYNVKNPALFLPSPPPPHLSPNFLSKSILPCHYPPGDFVQILPQIYVARTFCHDLANESGRRKIILIFPLFPSDDARQRASGNRKHVAPT